MKSFERASTGIPGLDEILDDLRLGDNVVWQVNSIEDYRHFVDPFVENALQEDRRVVYMRFGMHAPIVNHPRVAVYNLEAELGFEPFLAQVQEIAFREGPGTFYVFDSLSDLLSIWATDLMIGNFFRVACPYLYKLYTIAYFAVLRDRNSYQTVARIRETTQLLLDVYFSEEEFYVHPLKVMGRYSPTMFLPHVLSDSRFLPITSSVETARLFSLIRRSGTGNTERKIDYWDRLFLKAEELLERQNEGVKGLEQQLEDTIAMVSRMILGREERILDLSRKYFSLADLLEIRHRMIGTGYIGGKSVGMLLARAILRADDSSDWQTWLEPHDSFYVGSDVFYTYLVENQCWDLRLEQKQENRYFSAAEELKERIAGGVLPEMLREQFIHLLEYFGQSPIIVRSSSLLEDSFGNAFAGKYESVFCVNQGTPQGKYRMLEEAIKKVYASTMNEDALAYRQMRGLAQSDEQMSLLIQRVSGSHRGHFFFPDLAGVALSRNPYPWKEEMSSEAGMLRLVAGLGTRAVDRVEDDYPRVVALDFPGLRPESDPDEIRRFSQHRIDLLDLSSNVWDSVPLKQVFGYLDGEEFWRLMATKDNAGIKRAREMGREPSMIWTLNFDGLLNNTSFPAEMQRVLMILEQAYEYPVDMEFTANYVKGGNWAVNIVQCRPFQLKTHPNVALEAPGKAGGSILLSTQGSFMGNQFQGLYNWLIYVVPDEYAVLTLPEKYEIARMVGRLNRHIGQKNEKLALIGPGRWGSSTPSLGVPVSFAEISNVALLVEVASSRQGLMPELSFGTHFFQDLVECGATYAAIFPEREGVVFAPGLLETFPNRIAEFFPRGDKWGRNIRVISLQRDQLKMLIDWGEKALTVYLNNG